MVLKVNNLSVQFTAKNQTIQAVDSVSFELQKGKTLGLVGESGSGKSVTSLAIMGLLGETTAKIPQGEIKFAGKNLLQLSDKELQKIRGNRMSMIFQEPMTALNPVQRVGTQISEVLRLHKKMAKKAAWKQSIELLEKVGINHAEQRVRAYPHELSGGQKQRVMIAMAIACEPDVLIADEPTTALDVTVQKQVLQLLKDLQESYQMAILFITHDLGVVADLADEVIVMRRAKIVEQGSVKAVFQNPQHPYTKGLMACRPKLQNNPARLLTLDDFLDEKAQAKTIEVKKTLAVSTKTSANLKKASKVLLEVKNLSTHFVQRKGFKKHTIQAVNDVSLQVYKGETLGIVGESGSGKTTLGRTILRLQKANSGTVRFDGQSVFELSAKSLRKLRARMQIIFQDPHSSLNPRMTVEQILLEPMLIHGVESNVKNRLEKVVHLLEKVGLGSSCLSRYPHEFSGGQKQRIGIARAISIEPDFIICDESVSALDVSVQATVLNLLKDLQQEFELTYIFISHDLAVVNCMANRVAVMQKGRIVELNTVEKIYQQPQQAYTRNLLKSIPQTFLDAQ